MPETRIDLSKTLSSSSNRSSVPPRSASAVSSAPVTLQSSRCWSTMDYPEEPAELEWLSDSSSGEGSSLLITPTPDDPHMWSSLPSVWTESLSSSVPSLGAPLELKSVNHPAVLPPYQHRSTPHHHSVMYSDENMPSSSASSSKFASSSNSCTPTLGSSTCFSWSTLLGDETPTAPSRAALHDITRSWGGGVGGPEHHRLTTMSQHPRAPLSGLNHQTSSTNLQLPSNSPYLTPIPFQNLSSSSKSLLPISYQSLSPLDSPFGHQNWSTASPGILRRSTSSYHPNPSSSSRTHKVPIFTDELPSSSTPTTSIAHIGSIHRSPAKEHECRFPDCTDKEGQRRRFKRLDHLRRHQNTCHGGHRPFSCWVSTCTTKPFSRRDNLNAHLKKIHGLQLKRQKKRYVAVMEEGDGDEFYEPYFHGSGARDMSD